MSGHSKWSQIKRKKEATDQKRGQVFSKLLRAVSLAARGNPNPEANATLKRTIDEARKANVPKENIERALLRAAEAGDQEGIVIEAYGPEGAAVLVACETDNKNRTIQEVKIVLKDNGGKWADPGSVMWAFESADEAGWKAKFPQEISEEGKNQLKRLVSALEAHDDVVGVYTNVPAKLP